MENSDVYNPHALLCSTSQLPRLRICSIPPHLGHSSPCWTVHLDGELKLLVEPNLPGFGGRLSPESFLSPSFDSGLSRTVPLNSRAPLEPRHLGLVQYPVHTTFNINLLLSMLMAWTLSDHHKNKNKNWGFLSSRTCSCAEARVECSNQWQFASPIFGLDDLDHWSYY